MKASGQTEGKTDERGGETETDRAQRQTGTSGVNATGQHIAKVRARWRR